VDPVHFSPEGSELFAKALAAYVDAPGGPRGPRPERPAVP